MRELLITTGHNSSVILIEDGEVMWGYETERLTGVKSDSRFPLQFLEHQTLGRIDLAHVTHWSPDGRLSSMKPKYWDASYLEGVPIHTLSPEFDAGRSHHDTHMAAALAYADSGLHRFPREGSYGLIVDGFGTLGEHFSVYDLSAAHGKPVLVKRIHGYGTSLGLWYQYATAFLGMKMHEDEYKLLGYETHIEDGDRWHIITGMAMNYANEWIDEMHRSIYGSRYDPLYSVDALPAIKDKVFRHLAEVADELGVTDVASFEGRAIMACYVQTMLETVVIALTLPFHPKNLVLSGGVFYNVKLNKRLMECVNGQTCVYPLAGDQGNALGLYAMSHPSWKFPSSFCWGQRVLRDVGRVEGLFVGDEGQVYNFVSRQLRDVGYVNLVRDGMEFGPRALCNTSTIALPTSNIVQKINAMNDRNTVMPMAPVMGLHTYQELFERTDHVWLSYKHMVIAMKYRAQPFDREGVAHRYQWPLVEFTGRPQVVSGSDTFMHSLLDEFGGVLINTSFNFHGQPIAFGMDSVVKNHMEERRRDGNITTAVIANV